MIDPVARDYRAIRGDPGDRKCAAALARGRGGEVGGGRRRKRTRIFSGSDNYRLPALSSDAYRDGSGFQSSRFPFPRYRNPSARSGDIAARASERAREREREREREHGESNQSDCPQSRVYSRVKVRLRPGASLLIDRDTDTRFAPLHCLSLHSPPLCPLPPPPAFRRDLMRLVARGFVCLFVCLFARRGNVNHPRINNLEMVALRNVMGVRWAQLRGDECPKASACGPSAVNRRNR